MLRVSDPFHSFFKCLIGVIQGLHNHQTAMSKWRKRSGRGFEVSAMGPVIVAGLILHCGNSRTLGIKRKLVSLDKRLLLVESRAQKWLVYICGLLDSSIHTSIMIIVQSSAWLKRFSRDSRRGNWKVSRYRLRFFCRNVKTSQDWSRHNLDYHSHLAVLVNSAPWSHGGLLKKSNPKTIEVEKDSFGFRDDLVWN